MTEKQHIIAVRTLRRGREEDSDFPGMDQTNGFSNPHNTQSQITDILGKIGGGRIPYGRIAVVHSNQPSFPTEDLLMDRIRRFSGYHGIQELGGKIDLRETESDNGKKIQSFLDNHFQTNKKILIILCGLPWVPALIQEGLDIGGTLADTPLEELQYIFPSGYAFDFTRKVT